MLQVVEAELRHQVVRLADRCAKLETSLQQANNETEQLRVELIDRQLPPPQFTNQPLLLTLQQRIDANKVVSCIIFVVNLCCPCYFSAYLFHLHLTSSSSVVEFLNINKVLKNTNRFSVNAISDDYYTVEKWHSSTRLTQWTTIHCTLCAVIYL